MRFAPASLSLALTCLALGAPMALSQDALTMEDLAMPALLPGYYNQTVTIQRLDILMPDSMPGTKLGDLRDIDIGRDRAPVTERICNTGDELFRASEFLPGGTELGERCRVIASSMVGTRGTGEFRCTVPEAQMQMTIRYEGDFTETSRRATVSMQMRSKSLPGGMNFKLNVAEERITDSCTDDLPPAEDAATPAPRAPELDAMKKM